MKILVIDNYDSFTWNLVHVLQELNGQVDVVRNEELEIESTHNYSKILLSPGPGLPADAGLMPALIADCVARSSLLGVCLGMQGIATHFGAKLTNLPEVMHGRETKVEVTDDSEILFSGIDLVFSAGLYHSWAVEDAGLPSCLKVTARSPEGIIMAISHRELDVKGVQFHPESIMTPAGKKIMSNWLGVS